MSKVRQVPRSHINLWITQTGGVVDAALAGLIGALGGSALGAGGAWGAARIAFKDARYQADIQAKGAHDQWLRQIRRDAYAQYVKAAKACVRAIVEEQSHGINLVY